MALGKYRRAIAVDVKTIAFGTPFSGGMSRQERRFKRADQMREAFSARNRQIVAALSSNIFDAFETGSSISQLCQEYGLTAERIRDILKDEKHNRNANAELSVCRFR